MAFGRATTAPESPPFLRSADCQSAIQQSATLRYRLRFGRHYQSHARIRALASFGGENYSPAMILIRFPDAETERHGLGFLAGRFSFKSWATGETMVPEDALASLAYEGIRFAAEGPATSQRLMELRKTNPSR